MLPLLTVIMMMLLTLMPIMMLPMMICCHNMRFKAPFAKESLVYAIVNDCGDGRAVDVYLEQELPYGCCASDI